MLRFLQARENIYNHFQNSSCSSYFCNPSNEHEFVAYNNSMYLLQDTAESLLAHRQQGFSPDSHQAYIEFWGVMQAAFIQQDTIDELYNTITNRKLNTKSLTAWHNLRNLRNICAGHPANKSLPKGSPTIRTFMGRDFGNYQSISYEQWDQVDGRSHPRANLGQLIDEYACDATNILNGILSIMQSKWP